MSPQFLTGGGSSERHQAALVAGAIGDRSVFSAWLEARLKAGRVPQARLAAAINVSPSQLSGWIKGRDHVPPHQQIAMGDALAMSFERRDELMRVSDSIAALNDLQRTFHPQSRRRDPHTQDDRLAAYFSTPNGVLHRLLELVAALAQEDAVGHPERSQAFHLHLHLRAAQAVASDLDRFLGETDRRLFTPRNIETHLKYPTVHYLGFFLHGIGEQDGPFATTLRSDLNSALSDYLDYLNSADAADRAAANHALHLLARFGAPEFLSSVRNHGLSTDNEKVRMVLFAQVFGGGDVEAASRLSQRIVTDRDFGEVTTLFDGLHFGDYWGYLRKANLDAVPINALIRQIQGMSSTRDYARAVCAARVLNIIEQFGNRLKADAELMGRLCTKRTQLEDLIADAGCVATARDRLLHLITSFGKEGSQ